MDAVCELRDLQELTREAEALRIKTPEADALRTRTLAAKKWTNQIHNDLLRRVSSRKAATLRLGVPEVEQLLAEAAELRLDAVELSQARDRLEDAAKWAAEARAVLRPPVPVTPEILMVLENLTQRADMLNMTLVEQEPLEARMTHVND